MRLRSDSLHVAGWKRAHDLRGCACEGADLDSESYGHVSHLAEYAGVEPAREGDVWVGRGFRGEAVGYGLTCPEPTCAEGAHVWTHAFDCPAGRSPDAACKTGGAGCWTWTGSPAEGDLSAAPSLHVLASRGGCGWHGWLRAGRMVPA